MMSLSLYLCSPYMSEDSQRVVGGVLVGTGLWVTIIFIMRNALKCLLSWHGWMYNRHGSVSWGTRLWIVSYSYYVINAPSGTVVCLKCSELC